MDATEASNTLQETHTCSQDEGSKLTIYHLFIYSEPSQDLHVSLVSCCLHISGDFTRLHIPRVFPLATCKQRVTKKKKRILFFVRERVRTFDCTQG